MEKVNPLVSICIPAYNSAGYISKTIDCLLEQTYANIEILVVDDGSTDDTVDILKSIKDRRLTYVTQSNRGAAAARNAAFNLSTGSFIKYMDADDLLSENCIEQQLEKIIDRPNCIASAKWGRFYRPDGSDFKLSPEKVWKDLPGIDWLVNSLIDTGANMMQPGIFLLPRLIIEKVGPWNESLSLIDDFEFMVRVITNTEWVLFCEDSVLKYRSGIANNLSGQTTALHMNSAYRSLNLGIDKILATKNDALTRKACANTYRRWSFIFYPNYKDLFDKIETQIEKLGGSNISIVGSKAFEILSNILGWKTAKKIKIYINGVG